MTDDFLPPIPSPHGVGTSVEQPSDEWDGLDLTLSVFLSNQGTFRFACVGFLLPVSLVAAWILTTAIFLMTRTAFLHATRLPPKPITLIGLHILCFVVSSLLLVGIFTLWHAWADRHFEVEVQQKGLNIYYFKRDDFVLIPWTKVASVLHVNGDIWVTTSGCDYCLIPHDCFDSHQQSEHLAQFLRRLRDASKAE